MANPLTVEVKVADLPWFREFLSRVEDFIGAYAWHDRSCAAIDADGEWRIGNPDCTCGYAEELLALTKITEQT